MRAVRGLSGELHDYVIVLYTIILIGSYIKTNRGERRNNQARGVEILSI